MAAGDTIPTVILVGDTNSFTVIIADSNGNPVTVSVQGIPSNHFTINSLDDTVRIDFAILADQLTADTTYQVMAIATNPDSEDTLRFTFTFDVLTPVPPDLYSLWHDAGGRPGIPATIYYGDSVSYQVQLGDTAGQTINVQVQGIPPSLWGFTTANDTVTVDFNIIGDALVIDSTYQINISATGSGPEDTLSLQYSFLVLDTVDRPSLWVDTTGINIPDTLYYGDSIQRVLLFGDSAGNPLQTQVQGLPGTAYSVLTGDTVQVTLNLVGGDSLVHDSLYTVDLTATGSGPGDSLNVQYSFFVLDTLFSLWYERLSTDTIPDTLYYGDTLRFQMRYGTTHGENVDVIVPPLPSTSYSVDVTGDTALFSLTLTPEELPKDSLYQFQITVANRLIPDTLLFDYAFYVVDTVDRATLWLEGDSVAVPDTLYYGDSLHYELLFGDSTANPFQVTVQLPAAANTINTAAGDTARVAFDLIGSNLAADSMFSVVITATGSGPLDTLIWEQSFLVLDTTTYLWYNQSPDTLPNFVYHGESVAFALLTGQISGGPVEVQVANMPRPYTLDTLGDTVTLSMDLAGDSLAPDSQYVFSVNLNGTQDSVQLDYSFYVIDTTTPDDFSLWMNLVSPSVLPDTLIYGESLTAVFIYGDTSLRPVNLTVTGLPPSVSQIAGAPGDTTTHILQLVGDSLQYDSIYTITLRLRGSGPDDTLSFQHTLTVLDTTRLGGIKKLALGTYWREVQYDNQINTKDSANTSNTVRDNYEHRIYKEVTSVVSQPGALIYTIVSFDTLVGAGTVDTSVELIRHTDTAAQALIPQEGQFLDTLAVTFFSLPVEIGRSWSAVEVVIDSTINFFTLPVRLQGSYGGVYAITSINSFSAGTESFDCFRINSDLNSEVNLLWDSTVVVGQDTAYAGDSILHATGNTLGDHCISSDLTTELWSLEVTDTKEENFLEGVVVTNTLTSETILTEYYDPRRGYILNFQ